MKRAVISMAVFSMLLAGCGGPSTFIVSKDNRAYYLHRESKGLRRMLCESGDFRKILKDAAIPEDVKEGFYRYVCTEERSTEKVIALYTFLTPEERKAIKKAFVKNGYAVNYVPC